MSEKKVDATEVKQELTPEELTEEWKTIFNHFSNPDCTALGCYGRGWVGTNVETGKVIGCEKKGCAIFNLKRYELAERRRKRLEERDKKEREEKE